MTIFVKMQTCAAEYDEGAMPVYSSLNYAALEIGRRIRRERTRRGWTLADLAARLDTSIGSLSMVENEKALLTVDRLLSLSRVFGVSPGALFSSTRARHYDITRRSVPGKEIAAPPLIDRSGRRPRTYENRLRPLAASFVGKHMDPVEIMVLPVADRNVALISHHHEEFFCVLSGTVECLIETPDGRVRERLGPGDCMYFRSHLPHCIRAIGDTPAHSIHTLCPVPGDTESEHMEGSIAPIHLRSGTEGFRAEMAAKIRTLRQRRGLTRSDAAAALAISERKLAGIESGSRSVGLDLLVRICGAFGKPLEYFLASALIGRPFYAVQRAREIVRLRPRARRDNLPEHTTPPRNTFKSLAEAFGARGMYPYYVTVSSHTPAGASLHEHHGEEFVYVLSGEVSLVTIVEGSRVVETLGRGDSCYIDSTVPHRFIATAASPYHKSGAEVLDVFWCPLGEDYLFADAVSVAKAPAGRRRGARRR